MDSNLRQEHLENISRALVFVADKLEKLKVNWLLGASGSLMVWGVKVVPNDLDILVLPTDLSRVEKIFFKHITSPIQIYENTGREFSKFKMQIFGIEVEMIGRDVFDEKHVLVDFLGRKIPANPLEKELEFYEKRPEKKDRIELIKGRLKEIYGKD